MLDELDLRAGHRVLEIGTGTGWNAALLCERVGPTGSVTSIEVDPALVSAARSAIASAGYHAAVIAPDGWCGYDQVATPPLSGA